MLNCVRELRQKKGWSQHQLAKAAETSQQQVQRVEGGNQSVKLELALRLARALDADIVNLFPEAKKLGRTSSKRLSPRSLTRLANDPKTRRKFEEAGLETDTDSWFLKVRLVGGAEVSLPISGVDRDRFRHKIASLDDSAPFLVFESGKHHIALNLIHVEYVQETSEPDAELSEWAETGLDDDDVTVYLADAEKAVSFSPYPDETDPNNEDDVGSFHHILFMAESHVDEYQFFGFLDFDGEQVFLNARRVALLAIPQWALNPDEAGDEEQHTQATDGDGVSPGFTSEGVTSSTLTDRN
ncbi:MAG: helix-turn-helix transcriptional regulator [bacterium]